MAWSRWGSCLGNCGVGRQERQRVEFNCSYTVDSRPCQLRPCPIDGGWTKWSKWSMCTKTIGGIQTRTRECENPEPAHGGNPCNGSTAVVRECGNTSSCQEEFPLCFQAKEIPSRGTMEIYKNNTWKKLCTATWDTAEENLTCQAIGYSNTEVYDNNSGSNSTVRQNCTSLTNCRNNSDGNLQTCKVLVRLNGAKVDYGGRVEVFYRGKWGKICRSEWGITDAQVICRQLGFKDALAEFIGSDVQDSEIPFLMSDIDCKGHESELAYCKRTDGKVDCSDDKSAEALCEPKKRKVLPKDQLDVNIDSIETIQCSLQNETKHIKWLNSKGEEINSTSRSRIKAFPNGTLIINNVQLSDGGTYECRGLEYTRYYTVYVNARFSKVEPHQNLIAGKSGVLGCSAEGRPAPWFTWKRKDGRPLSKERFRQLPNGSMHVDPVHSKDGGEYICTINQNKKGRITRKPQTINASVIILPSIHLSGPSQPIREGDSVNLTCNVTAGFPSPQLRWSQNGEDLEENSAVLFLREVTEKDEGRYTCEATNSGGSSVDDVQVNVQVPPQLNDRLKDQSLPLNSTFSIKCTVRGDHPLKVNWTKDGVNIGNNNILTIDRVTFESAGRYGCSAENRAGKKHTNFGIDVTVSPQVDVSPKNQTVPEGNSANLTCKAKGVPKPTTAWNFNNGDLPSNAVENYIDEGSFLQLSNTTKDMEGRYTCTAKNKVNATTSAATLRVLEKPTAEIVPNPHPTLIVGDELKLTCEVNAVTTDIKWLKNGVLISPRAHVSPRVDDKSILSIEKVVEDDSGEYSCEASNEAGIVSRSSVEIEVRATGGSLKWYYIVGPILAVLLICSSVSVGWYLCKSPRPAAVNDPDEEEALEMELLNENVDHWEIARDRIGLREPIGHGAFGVVWRALLHRSEGRSGNRTVAAKCFTPTAGADGRAALMREIELGKLFGVDPAQPNIIKFLGCVTRRGCPIMVMEYLAYGDLLGYLRKSRGIYDQYHHGEGVASALQPYELVSFAKQIATGMVYLGSHGIIHRDLAARNILLDDHLVCKITDFGLAYQSFKYGHGNAKKGCIPVKWTSPEILLGNVESLSVASDVWSYGIVLYEIFTIGGIPYPGWSEGKVIAEVVHGYKMPKPPHVDDTLYEQMATCWSQAPSDRPPFISLEKTMDTYIRQKTYLQVLDMDKYKSEKYSKVEDIGAEQTKEELGNEQGAAAACAAASTGWD